MDIALWIVQVLLGLAFIVAGVIKAFNYERARAQLPWVKDLPRSLVTFIGCAELLGGIGLILPPLTGILPGLPPGGGGPCRRHGPGRRLPLRRSENSGVVTNVVLLLLAAFVAYGRWIIAPF
jgi:hypothetical protein